jgi:hypothetical protein
MLETNHNINFIDLGIGLGVPVISWGHKDLGIPLPVGLLCSQRYGKGLADPYRKKLKFKLN